MGDGFASQQAIGPGLAEAAETGAGEEATLDARHSTLDVDEATEGNAIVTT
jgi:hypothetical protein